MLSDLEQIASASLTDFQYNTVLQYNAVLLFKLRHFPSFSVCYMHLGGAGSARVIVLPPALTPPRDRSSEGEGDRVL